MTTISNQNSLLDPLARTKGGCATNSNNSTQPPPRREEDDEGYDGMMPILGIKQEDEDIASVEADGTGDPQPVCDSQSRDVEKKILTAALVTSIAEAPHSVAAPQVQGDPNRRVRARLDDKPAIKSGIDHTSISYPGGGSSHVTPTTSEASSFSSVETNDHESSAASNQKINDMSRPNNSAISNPAPSISNSRTIYPRASKAAACTKVTRALRLTSGTPTSPKGKRNIDAVESKAAQPTGKLMYHQPAQSEVPNPLAAIDKTTVAFQYLQYPNLKPPAKQAAEPQPSLAKQIEGGNSYPSVAEAMSTQQPQIDNLMSSSTNELMSSQNQQQQGRGRIFSVDLDPAVLDFVESVVDPLGNSDDTPEERSRNYSVTFDDDVNSNSGRLSFRRDRSFSFEFFSFGIDGDDLLPPIDETNPSSETKKGNRIRGDSIIFDPISFHDGGIHETSALMHVKHENRDNGQANAPEASAAAPQVHQIKAPPSIIHNPPQAMLSPTTPHYAVQKGHQRVALDKPPAKAKSTSVSQPKRTKRSSQKVHVPQQQGSSKYRQITITTSSSSSRNYPQSFDDNTIHMPHGSDAAAAAAAGIAQPASANTDGFSISHTSCPMELLNKGGRIGIYLPEERKARIAKFHDKRKQRMWRKKIKYDCRKKLADSRPRIKGRFVKRSDVDTED